MCTASLTWKCPGCGAIVTLSAEFGATSGRTDAGRLDQLAQALCGCWVGKIPDGGLARLLRAIMTGDENRYDDWKLGVPGSC